MRDLLGLAGSLLVGLIVLVLKPWSFAWWVILAPSATIFVWCVLRLLYHRSGKKRKHPTVPLVLLISGGALMVAGIILCAVGWYLWPSIKVHPSFAHAHSNYPRLGAPIEAAKASGNAYQLSHDRAMVLWFDLPLGFYQIPRNSQMPWIKTPDLDWTKDKSFTQALAKKYRNVPKDRHLPIGGVARNWVDNPQGWEWMGFMIWYCRYDNGQILSQKFENGTVMGVFRSSEDERLPGFVYILWDDAEKTRDTYLSREIAAPDCHKDD